MVDIVTTPEAGSAEERRQQIQDEYGAYVAAEDITINGVLAFAKGYPVPKSHLDTYPALKNAVEKAEVPAEAPAASESDPPARNADRPTWAAYAQAHGATAEELADDGLGRNELRDKYGPQA